MKFRPNLTLWYHWSIVKIFQLGDLLYFTFINFRKFEQWSLILQPGVCFHLVPTKIRECYDTKKNKKKKHASKLFSTNSTDSQIHRLRIKASYVDSMILTCKENKLKLLYLSFSLNFPRPRFLNSHSKVSTYAHR